MPNKCKECPCNQYNYNADRYECGAWLFYSKSVCHMKSMEDIETKPNWCPLKPMPQKKEILDSRMKTAIGWNECIDEILGGEHDS